MSAQPLDGVVAPDAVDDRSSLLASLETAANRVLEVAVAGTASEPAPLRVLPAPAMWAPRTLSPQELADRARARERAIVQECLAVDLDPVTDELVDYTVTPTHRLPDVESVLPALVLGTLEAMDGLRSPAQVSRWFAPALIDRITRRHQAARRRGTRARGRSKVLKVHACHVTDSIAEASVVVAHAGRVRAMALRLVGVDGRWMVTVMEIG